MDVRPAFVINNLIGHKLLVVLDGLVIVFPPDQPFHVVEGPAWIDGCLVFGCLPDQTVFVGECDNGRCDPVA